MRVILNQNIDKLGIVGDEVNVKPGYARNFLIPKGFAVPFNEQNKKAISHQKKVLEEKRQALLEASRGLAERLRDNHLEFVMKSGDGGKLFGSVTSKMIMDAFAEKGIELEKKRISMDVHLKTLGTHTVPVYVEGLDDVNITVVVKQESAEAEEKKPEAPAEEAE